MRYLPYFPLALAVLLILVVINSEDPSTRQTLAGWVAVLLGLSATLAGVKAVLRGRVLMRTREATREGEPVAFWTTVLLFRFLLGAILIGAGFWSLTVGGA